MGKEYQGFAISNFRTGFDEAVEPWLLPRDAYQVMLNAHLYRGVLEKIDGYQLFAEMSHRTQITLVPAPDGVTTTFTGTLTSQPTSSNFFGYGTLVAGSSAQTVTYQSDGVFPIINLAGSGGSTGTVNLTTLAVSITFGTPPPLSAYSTVLFQWDAAPASATAIMGIKQYYASNGTQKVMVFDQKRMGIIGNNLGILAAPPKALQYITEVPHDYYQAAVFTGNGVLVTFTGNLTINIVPGTVRFYQFTPTGVPTPVFSDTNPTGNLIVDNGQGKLSGDMGPPGSPNPVTGSINYSTGAYTLTFTTAPANGNVFDATSGIYGDIFTGSISNFFSVVNYLYNAFFTNGVDPIFYYDGTVIHYLNTSLSVKLTTATTGVPDNYDLTTCLHVTVDRGYLLLMAPTLRNVGKLVNFIYWSAINNPFNFTDDNFLPAPTSEPIRAFDDINTDLVVRFASSERIFRFTGDAFAPWRWDSTNNTWDCDAPYSVIDYSTWFSSVGKPGIVGSDGVNIKRADEIIPDFTDPTRLSQQVPVPFISQTSIAQCYGERFDDIKEGWLCYNSGLAENAVTASDNVLSFNYIDETYAIYQFPFSCLGFGSVTNGQTWAQTFTTWEKTSNTWQSYYWQKDALTPLGGDQFDKVYALNQGNTLTLPGDATATPTPVLMNVISKNFNPFIEEGQLARLGYIDLYVSAYDTSTLRVQFYVNDQLRVDSNGDPIGFYQENTLVFNETDALSPTTQQTKVWKRIYVGSIGRTHTIRFYQNILDFETNIEQPIYIHAMILYMKPAGRVFQ